MQRGTCATQPDPTTSPSSSSSRQPGQSASSTAAVAWSECCSTAACRHSRIPGRRARPKSQKSHAPRHSPSQGAGMPQPPDTKQRQLADHTPHTPTRRGLQRREARHEGRRHDVRPRRHPLRELQERRPRGLRAAPTCAAPNVATLCFQEHQGVDIGLGHTEMSHSLHMTPRRTRAPPKLRLSGSFCC